MNFRKSKVIDKVLIVFIALVMIQALMIVQTEQCPVSPFHTQQNLIDMNRQEQQAPDSRTSLISGAARFLILSCIGIHQPATAKSLHGKQKDSLLGTWIGILSWHPAKLMVVGSWCIYDITISLPAKEVTYDILAPPPHCNRGNNNRPNCCLNNSAFYI